MAQLQKKFLASNAVDGSKFRLSNNEFLRSRNAADSGDVNMFKVNASDRIEFASLPQVTSDPSAGNDLVRKSYVDAVAQGLKPKQAVRVATTAAITIATDLNSGDSIDGITLANGDRVLVKDQGAADKEQNGIYIVGASPARSSDFDSLSPIDEINGAYTFVQEGSTNTGKGFVQTGTVSVLDTDDINFVFFNSAGTLTGHDMISISGTQVSVDLASTSGLESSSPGNAGGQLRVKLEASNPSLEINGSNELKVKLDAAGAIASGASGLAVQVDNTGIEINTNALRLKDDGVTKAKLNSDVAGIGIVQAAGGELDQLAKYAPYAAATFAADEGIRAKDAGGTSRFLVGYFDGTVLGLPTDCSAFINEIVGKPIFLLSNHALAGATATGNVGIQSGGTFTAATGATGTMDIRSGNVAVSSSSAASGTATFQSGNNSGDGASGSLTLKSGNQTKGAASSNSGAVSLSSGNVSGSGNSGDISISTGTSGSGSRGVVTLSASTINLNATVEISANSKKIVSLADPTSAQDAATKAYVDGLTFLTAGNGLDLTGSTLSVNVDASSIEINADTLRVKALGITNAMLAGSIEDSKLNQLTTANKVAGSAIQLGASSGLEDSTGLKIKLEASNPSLQVSSGELGVKLGDGIEKGASGIYVDSYRHAEITLAGGDITSEYYDLAVKLIPASAELVVGGVPQSYGIDWDIDNSGSVSRVRWDGTNLPSSDLRPLGAAALIAGDKLYIKGIKL